MTAPSGLPPSGTIRDKCLADHRRIEDLVGLAREALESGDPALYASRWTECALALCRHMEAEERHMLPRLLAVASRLARTLVAEHGHLRRRLAELAGAPPSPGERVEQLGRFLEELRAHGRHEEAVLYPWADENLDPAEREALLVT
jgi:hemerythrin superfamily protein